jgi:hypothetical protein
LSSSPRWRSSPQARSAPTMRASSSASCRADHLLVDCHRRDDAGAARIDHEHARGPLRPGPVRVFGHLHGPGTPSVPHIGGLILCCCADADRSRAGTRTPTSRR